MERIEFSLTRWLAVRAHGTNAIWAAVILVIWRTALCFAYLILRMQ
jgi:hypothetical protein